MTTMEPFAHSAASRIATFVSRASMLFIIAWLVFATHTDFVAPPWWPGTFLAYVLLPTALHLGAVISALLLDWCAIGHGFVGRRLRAALLALIVLFAVSTAFSVYFMIASAVYSTAEAETFSV